MKQAISVSYIYGVKNQRLRNVTVHSPSLFWVQSGKKSLFWQDSDILFDSSNVLLTQAQQQLSFENKPTRATFSTYQFSFFISPPKSMLELSEHIGSATYQPDYAAPQRVLDTLKLFTQIAWQELSKDVQKLWLFGLYQQLAEEGRLHHIFTDYQQSFSQKVSQFLAHTPDHDHQLNIVAEHFSMSRATFIRHLKKEHTQFKTLLAQVRMNHALSLMQKGYRKQTDIALRCGYQSSVRFSQRFQQQFGLNPKQYLKTLTPS
ncbi:helix-turn-helix transcriptional regulator [Marinomonas sp. C2222]|uniref:Helix-turn-helix transcriptional regulator n=1 Tax=Marinomonas sargassi TaxID=2984494 RepID=A0ABT2YTA1_9GAMM|nr:AraC family transcriptional regulator [Marinomonas sargassi]MCV2403127.1 helix-turn-helix transcriptional regulator [Marinomonas sargassi]